MGSFMDEFNLRFENRNAEEVHKEALDAAKAFHDEINASARRATKLYEARQHQLQLQQQAIQEEERVKLLEERAREEIRLREIENRARLIPKVPARVPTPPAPSVETPKSAVPPSLQPTRPSIQPAARPTLQAATTPTVLPKPQPPTAQPIPVSQTTQPPTTQPANPFSQPTTQPPAQSSNPNPLAFATPNQAQPVRAPQVQPQSDQIQNQSFLLKGVQRYAEIHQALKEMRNFVNNACDQDKSFKKAVGELRREIRMKLGQIVKDKSQNREPMNKIFKALEQSLQLPSPGVDPRLFMVSKPEPLQEALNNGDEIPILFIFLLNMFAKYAISQLINEASVNPDIADPIGVVIIQVFARASFLWRGQSLIDIFMAKMRVSCPVLFGVRGNETTEQGRADLGWLKESKEQGAPYMSDEMHGSRMTGLAAGYAAVSLRDFSKSSLKNPWVPTHYWSTMASIVATPPNERSTTQYLVLRALIDGFEQPFLKFYGTTALAALKVALIAFPEGASVPGSSVDAGSSAVGGVKVLVEKLGKAGIVLR